MQTFAVPRRPLCLGQYIQCNFAAPELVQIVPHRVHGRLVERGEKGTLLEEVIFVGEL
jgi:hypothetical protein